MATARPSRPAPRRPAPPRSALGGGAAGAASRRRRVNARLAYDLAGIGLIALALILLATLLWPPSRTGENVVGTAVISGMRIVVGAGVWAFPCVLLVCGILLAVGRNRS